MINKPLVIQALLLTLGFATWVHCMLLVVVPRSYLRLLFRESATLPPTASLALRALCLLAAVLTGVWLYASSRHLLGR
jgi:hypothetical protein